MGKFLSPPQAKASLPKEEIKSTYSKYRWQVFIGIFIGYAAFYLVRKNFSLAMPIFEELLGIKKAELGAIFALNAFAYGLSKFLMGGVSDRSDAKKFLPLGLILASLAICFAGITAGTSLFVMGLAQFLIGWLGGMGWPPCGRVMTHWFSNNERGTKMSIWNCAHNVGGAAVGPLCTFGFGYMMYKYGIGENWKEVLAQAQAQGPEIYEATKNHMLFSAQFGYFYLPAFVAIIIAIVAFLLIKDNPTAEGLPTIEEYRNDYPKSYSEKQEEVLSTKDIIFKYVLTNKVLWFVAFANVFVYMVRYGVLDWAPTYLEQVKGYNIKEVGWAYAYYELAAIPGTLICGWISDKAFKGKRAIPNIIFMAITAIFVLIYWKSTTLFWDNFSLVAIGFFIYGPIMLIGVQALDLSPKNAAGTSAGLTGFFGYVFGTAILANTFLGSILPSKTTDGSLVEAALWSPYFIAIIGACFISIILMLFVIKKEKDILG